MTSAFSQCFSLLLLLLALFIDGVVSRKAHHGPIPMIVPGKMAVEVDEGDLATLPCTVQNLGTREVSWRLQGDDYFLTIGSITWVQDSNLMIEHKEWSGGALSEWNLVFRSARPEDAGIYECQIIHTDSFKWNVTLTVIEKAVLQPAIAIEGKQFVESGEKIHITCNSTEGSRVPEDVDWFMDGNKIDSNTFPHVIVTKYHDQSNSMLVSELLIERAKSTDSGTYICRSSLQQIASHEVTVLVAESTNTKRGSGSSQTARPHSTGENCAMTFSVLLGNPCIFSVLVALTYLLTFNFVIT